MKTTLYYTIFLFAIFFGGCDSSTNSPKDPDLLATPSAPKVDSSLASVLAQGKLVAILNNTPTSYFIHRGQPLGFQYELLSKFATSLGVDLEVKMIASIPDAIDSLQNNKAHIVASGLTVLGERKKHIDFTLPIIKTKQILIQRLPENHRTLSAKKIQQALVNDVTELALKTVYVEEGSSYVERLINLQEEIGDSIHMVTYGGEIDLDSIMRNISDGAIDYAIAEDYNAHFFSRFYDNIDIGTPVSLDQNIAWAVHKNANTLLDTLNNWIKENRSTTYWAVVYDKYFKHNKRVAMQIDSDFRLANGRISPYDEIIKENAEKIGWNWLLLSAQIQTESKFDPNARSWVGAVGLMQIMPATARGITPHHLDIHNAKVNIETGTKLNQMLFDYWNEIIPDSIQALKFTLASYNIGKGHVFDAQRLAEKYHYDPHVWDNNVELMIKNLSQPKYFRDSVVRYGYCRGSEAYHYVKRIFSLYDNYSNYFEAIN